MNMKKLFLVCVLTVFAATSMMKANIILSDSFTYPDGPLVGAPGSPWVTHNGTTPVLATNGQIRLSGGNSEDVNALLSGGPYTTNGAVVLYSSFKVRFTSLPGMVGTYFAHFKDTNSGAASGFGGRVWTSTTNAAAGKFRLGIGNGTSATATNGQIATDLSLNTVYTIVTRFVPATGLATIWLDPTAESDPSVTANDEGTSTRPNPIDVFAYAFRQATGIGALLVDDLRVGTSFADVAGPNNPPFISGVANQHIAANASTPDLPFTIGDVETAPASLEVTASSGNLVLAPNENISLGGTDSNRTVKVTPAGGQQGVTTITLTVTDEGGISASTSFTLSVGVPSISDIPNQTTPANTLLGPISFTVADTESAAGDLTVTASSSNQGLVPDGNISVDGTDADRTITITPTADTTGLATITVTVSDGLNSASDTFVLTVNPLLGLLRSDDFNRPDGPLVQFDGQWLSNGGTGATNVQQMQIIGGKVQVTEDGSEDVSSELPPNQPIVPVYTPSSGVILYAGMRITLTRLPSSAGSYFTHFRDGGNGFRARIFVSTLNAASGSFRLGIANNAAAISASGQIAADLSLNTSYFIVVRYNVGTGESKLWLNPVDETSSSLMAPDSPSPSSIEAFTFRQNSGIGVVCVDDLKIGTAFSDVAPFGLRITKMGTAVEISWPVAAQGYTLQSSEGLSPADWSDYPDQGMAMGGRNVVTITDVTGTRFFRLFKP